MQPGRIPDQKDDFSMIFNPAIGVHALSMRILIEIAIIKWDIAIEEWELII